MKAGKRGLTGKHLEGRKGLKSNGWQGGRYISKGYICVWVGQEHPMANSKGYVLEHRLVLSEHLGRPLLVDEIVHHKDANKLNNEISNLELMTRNQHADYHRKEIAEAMKFAYKNRRKSYVCSGCGIEFFPKRRPRFEKVFCSKKCFLLHH